jgi:hypothetical protein
MRRIIFYLVLVTLITAWAIGNFYLNEDIYIHLLLVISGLLLAFRYVYRLQPAKQAGQL